MITQKRLKELLHYNQETGIFTWRVTKAWLAKKGQKAGCVNKTGYAYICIDGHHLRAHRLVWLYMEGYLPVGIDVEHKNRIRDDNRWENLRLASRQCNLRNSKVKKTNTSGVKGVYWHKQRNKWRVQMTINYKQHCFGYYVEFKDAVKARWEAEIDNNYPSCNTTSSAYQYLKKNNYI